MRAMTSVAASAPGASFDARLSAYLIDGLIIFVPTYPIFFGRSCNATSSGGR